MIKTELGRSALARRELGRRELVDAANMLRRLLEAVRTRHMCAPADVVARLEGAVIALEAVATGKMPDPNDLLVPGPYTV